ncbi:hypothetical protein HDV06_005842 [Boothiomyces sp. JEL0866]|nr:hypothetical protein HDV06_005842 [Boothiomyces sp. JEL0866]
MLSHHPEAETKPTKVLDQLFPSEDEEDSDFVESEQALSEDESDEEQEIPKEEVAEILIDSQAIRKFPQRRFVEMDFDEDDDQEYVESEEELTEDEEDLDELEEEEPMNKELESVTENLNKIRFVEQELASDDEDEDYQESIDTVSEYDSEMDQDLEEVEVDQEEVVDNLINAGRVVEVDLLMKDERILRDGKEIGQVGDIAAKIGQVIHEKL